MNAPFTIPPADLLAPIVDELRPSLGRQFPLKARIRAFWAAAKHSRGLTAGHVVAAGFFDLARDTGLVADLNDPVRRLSGEEAVRHVLRWAVRGINPFETGPLQ